jgi:YbgC/YbaW family acyl-CoA thioester hydrolase
MARLTINLPNTFNFSTTIPVRITDLNYGGHVGNDTILSIIHEARAQFLQSFGYSEKDLGGVGTIMSDVAINFKNELFYGDVVSAAVAVMNVSRASFDLVYLLKKNEIIIAEAKTGMVCFDYNRRKVTSLPEKVKQRLDR